jgi:hypothetical protein
MGAPPDGWFDTIPIGRSPSYFRFNNRLCSIIAVSWECQLKTVEIFARISLGRGSRAKDQGRNYEEVGIPNPVDCVSGDVG